MKTIKINIYSFDELSDKAKEKARQWYREGFDFQFSNDIVIEEAKNIFKFVGYDISKIYYSGFSSQGDGACFEGSWKASDVNASALKTFCPLDQTLHKIADQLEKISKDYPYAYLRVNHSGHYSHKYCTDFNISIVDENGDENCSTGAAEAEKSLIEVSRDAMDWIYRQLEKNYNWEMEDCHVEESIKNNEYTFTEEGKRFG